MSKKYIIIPDFVPLYAMRKVYGPQNGPIRKPILVDTEIIKELLKQRPPVKVIEVRLTSAKLGKYDKTVELNLDNYNLDNFTDNQVQHTSVEQVTQYAKNDVVYVGDLNLLDTLSSDDNDSENVVNSDDEKHVVVSVEDNVTVTSTVTNSGNPHKKLSKAERRELARAEAEARVKNSSDK